MKVHANEPSLAPIGSTIALPTIPKGFTPLKPPKRGASRESLSDSVNSIRRVAVDRIAATDHSLAYAWRYGCYLFDNCCYICEKPFEDGAGPQADHIIPPIEGGSGNAGNLLPAHRSCNHEKGDIHPDRYFKDRPDLLAKLHGFQELFQYTADKELFSTASHIASAMAESITKQILQARNRRELALDDTALDSIATTRATAPSAITFMSAVRYFLDNENYAPSAKEKMFRYTQRILQKWYGKREDVNLFTQSEDVIRAFILEFCLDLTPHIDSFNRANRAFRILAEIFDSKTLAAVYEESTPVTLQGVQELYDYTADGWVRKSAATATVSGEAL